MTTHFSAWPDRAWDGCVCDAPHINADGIAQQHIRESREDDKWGQGSHDASRRAGRWLPPCFRDPADYADRTAVSTRLGSDGWRASGHSRNGIRRPMFHSGERTWSFEHQQVCGIVQTQDLRGDTLYRAWLPAKGAIVRVRSSQRQPPAETAPRSSACLSYPTAAARVSGALTQEVLLAPTEASVISLSHQIRTLSRAVSDEYVRRLRPDPDPERRRSMTMPR